jgi:hypothetical protein
MPVFGELVAESASFPDFYTLLREGATGENVEGSETLMLLQDTLNVLRGNHSEGFRATSAMVVALVWIGKAACPFL